MQCEYCGRNNFRNKETCAGCGALLSITPPIAEQNRYRKHVSKRMVAYGGSGGRGGCSSYAGGSGGTGTIFSEWGRRHPW